MATPEIRGHALEDDMLGLAVVVPAIRQKGINDLIDNSPLAPVMLVVT